MKLFLNILENIEGNVSATEFTKSKFGIHFPTQLLFQM